MGIRKCSTIDKKFVLYKESSKRSIRRQINTFFKSLEKINQGSKYPVLSRWLCNSLSKENFFQSKISIQLVTWQERQKLMDEEVKEMLQKAIIRKTIAAKGGFLGKLLLYKASNKSEIPKGIYTILSLQRLQK